MIKFVQRGTFGRVNSYFERLLEKRNMGILNRYGELGVKALSDATPVDTGLTASSWYYTIERSRDSITLSWHNSNVIKDYANVAILLQYGHATRNGGFVQGRDYINPAIRPIMDELAEKAWKELIG